VALRTEKQHGTESLRSQ